MHPSLATEFPTTREQRTFQACLHQSLHLSSTGNPCDGINALTPKELKQELVAKGFLVLRSEARRIVLATRERENLIMDSGVWVEFDPNAELLDENTRFAVGCTVRSQHSDQRGESEGEGQIRARAFARVFLDQGYTETSVDSVKVENPSVPHETLDIWHQVSVLKSGIALAQLPSELQTALRLPKIAE